jgi:hypothetical protein
MTTSQHGHDFLFVSKDERYSRMIITAFDPDVAKEIVSRNKLKTCPSETLGLLARVSE